VNKIAAISFSGGMDSTSLLLHLLNKNYNVYSLTYDYGQKHIIEIEKSKKIIRILNNKGFSVKQKIIDISSSMSILDSSLTNKNSEIPKGHYEDKNMKETVVPNRNAIFISFLYAYALTLNKNLSKSIDLSLGVHSGDHEIYPDCRPAFYEKIMCAFQEGNWNSEYISLYLPYVEFDKADILKDALDSCDKLNLDFNKIFQNTLTSYEPDANGVSNGKTGSDIERILAFNKLGLKDPIVYKDSWESVLNNALKISNKLD